MGNLQSGLRSLCNNNNFKKLTERVEELRSLSPPQCLVVIGDDIIGLVLVNLCVEGHFIQEVVHLSQGRKSVSLNHLQTDKLHVNVSEQV